MGSAVGLFHREISSPPRSKTILVIKPISFATKTNKNSVTDSKWKLLTSFDDRLSFKIPRTKSIRNSITFCFPFGFSCKFRVQMKTSANTMQQVNSVINTTVPSNQIGPIWKSKVFSFKISHLFSCKILRNTGKTRPKKALSE